MATKKSASKKVAGSGTTAETPVKTAAKKTVVKSAAKKVPENTVNVQASATEHGAESSGSAQAGHAAPAHSATHVSSETKRSASHHEISVRAHEKWERSGRQHGHHQEHWLEAERELNS